MFRPVFHRKRRRDALHPKFLFLFLKRVQYLLHCVEDHLARHAIDRALPDRLLEPRLRHPADALTTGEIQPSIRRRKRPCRHRRHIAHLNIGPDFRAVRDIRIIAGVLLGREAAIRRRIHRQRHQLRGRSRTVFH